MLIRQFSSSITSLTHPYLISVSVFSSFSKILLYRGKFTRFIPVGVAIFLLLYLSSLFLILLIFLISLVVQQTYFIFQLLISSVEFFDFIRSSYQGVIIFVVCKFFLIKAGHSAKNLPSLFSTGDLLAHIREGGRSFG